MSEASVDSTVSVIVVTFNSARTIKFCLDSLASQTLIPHEVFVVDNSSSDATLSALEERSGIKLLALTSNIGFPGACNLAARAAGGKFLAFVNPDLSLSSDCLERLVDFLETNPKVGAVSSKIYLSDLVRLSRARVNADGNDANYLLFAWARRCGLEDMPESNPFPVLYPSGAAMVIRKDAFDDLGGFDSDLFLYHDDVDLGLRLRIRGWDIVSVPSATAFHDYEFLRHSKKFFYLERNRLIVLTKIFSLSTLLKIFPALVVAEIAVVAFAASSGWFSHKAASYVEFARKLPATFARRKEVARTRSVKDSQILRYCLGGIYHPFLSESPWLSQLNRLLEKYRKAFLTP